jgi:hypothetical protein
VAAKITGSDYRNVSKNDEGLKGLAIIWFDEIISTWRKWLGSEEIDECVRCNGNVRIG